MANIVNVFYPTFTNVFFIFFTFFYVFNVFFVFLSTFITSMGNVIPFYTCAVNSKITEAAILNFCRSLWSAES